MNHIRKQSTILVIPFVYRETFESLLSIPYFHHKKVRTDKIYDHIAALLDTSSQKHIGKAFSIDQNHRMKFDLPKSLSTPIRATIKGKDFFYTIIDIGVYVFSTQIGFLSIHVQVSTQPNHYDKQGFVPISTTDYEQFVYELRRFYYRDIAYEFCKKISKDEEEIVPLNLQKIIKQILAPLDVHYYFEQNAAIPTQSHVFNTLLVDEPTSSVADKRDKENDLEVLAYRLSHSFKNSYFLPSNLQSTCRPQTLFKPFDNSVWGIATEGLTNVISKTNQPDTDRFFEEGYFTNIEGTYFYLYLLLLNQKYSLLHLAIKAGEIYSEIKSLPIEKQAQKIYTFREEIIAFNLTTVYKHTSYITHQSDWYHFVQKMLEIDELKDELTTDVNALTDHLTIEFEQWERNMQKVENAKSQRTSYLIQLVTYILLPFTLVTGFFGMNLPMISTMGNWMFIVALVTLFMILFAIHFSTSLKNKKE